MNPELLERYWRDPANWKKGLYYRCPEDPRLIVPKKQKWRGWTLNFAKPMAVPALIIIILVVAGPLVVLPRFGYDPRSPLWWVTLAGVALVLISGCAYAASPRRFAAKPNK